STRRLIIHESIYETVKETLVKAYQQIRIGDPLDAQNHAGPVIDKPAVQTYLQALEAVKKAGGKFAVEGAALSGAAYESGCYVSPSIAEVENHWEIVQEETFAPLLYLIKYSDFDEAIAIQNGVKQGLSSAI